MAKKATVADAQLIVQLYDLRREAEMRKARNWWAGEFFPQNADDFLKVAWAMGTQEKQLVAPGWRILGHGFFIREQRSAERTVVPGPRIQRGTVLDLCQTAPLHEGTPPETERPKCLERRRNRRHSHQVGTRPPAIHDQARRADEAEKSRAKSQLSPEFTPCRNTLQKNPRA
jgi:hypothetical protein